MLDDEPQFCKAVGRLLKSHGFEVATYSRGEDLLAACAVELPDCLLLDLHMPVRSGFDILQQLLAKSFFLPAIVITGHDQPGNAERVHALGGVEYLQKPVNESLLLAAISSALEHSRVN